MILELFLCTKQCSKNFIWFKLFNISSSRTRIHLLRFLLYPWCLESCLAISWYAIKTCRMNKSGLSQNPWMEVLLYPPQRPSWLYRWKATSWMSVWAWHCEAATSLGQRPWPLGLVLQMFFEALLFEECWCSNVIPSWSEDFLLSMVHSFSQQILT